MSKILTSQGEYKVYFHFEIKPRNHGLFLEIKDLYTDFIYTGLTTCNIYLNNIWLSLGFSSCNTKYDQFNKREGRKIALGRALKQLNLTKENRKLFWEKLFPNYKR